MEYEILLLCMSVLLLLVSSLSLHTLNRIKNEDKFGDNYINMGTTFYWFLVIFSLVIMGLIGKEFKQE
jgi:hypothetical protein